MTSAHRTVPTSQILKEYALTEKSIILTGAAGGVGMDAIVTLARRGYTVFAGAIDPWEHDQLESIVSQNPGISVIPVALDLRKREQIEAVVKDVERRGLPLAGLVLNGAAAPHGVPAEQIEPELLRDVLETNVIGNFTAFRYCLPLLKKSAGRLVVISSCTTFAPPPLVMPYVTSKCALNAMTHTIRRELRNTSVRVILLLPEVIKETYMAYGFYETTRQHLAELRGCTPDEINKTTYDPGGNTALMQPADTPDPFYEGMLAGSFNTILVGIEKGIMPSAVTHFIVEALEAPEPKSEYVIGTLSKAFKFMAWILGIKGMDWILLKMGYK